jgi:hypothetical protein
MDELTDERIDELLDLLGYTDRWPGGTVDSLVSALYELRSRRAAGDEANGLLDALDTHFEGVLQGMYHFQRSLATPEGNPFVGSATRILGRAIVAEQKTAPAPAPEKGE